VRVATIYALVDPRTQAIRYVGTTIMPTNIRLNKHIVTARLTEKEREEWIQELLVLGLKPTIRSLQTIPWDLRDTRFAAETRWIIKLRMRGNLTNVRPRRGVSMSTIEKAVIDRIASEKPRKGQLTIRLNVYERKVLEKLAKKEQRSLGDTIRVLIERASYRGQP
jgi:hypothetical protein